MDQHTTDFTIPLIIAHANHLYAPLHISIKEIVVSPGPSLPLDIIIQYRGTQEATYSVSYYDWESARMDVRYIERIIQKAVNGAMEQIVKQLPDCLPNGYWDYKLFVPPNPAPAAPVVTTEMIEIIQQAFDAQLGRAYDKCHKDRMPAFAYPDTKAYWGPREKILQILRKIAGGE